MDYQAFLAVEFSASWYQGLKELFRPIVQLVDLMQVDMTFLRSVGKTQYRKATNPQDKIYGMMGLGGHNITNLLQPDYSVVWSNDTNAFYQALSYVWGSSTGTRTIALGKVIVPITDNLWKALSRLHGNEGQVLWVDTLCIDQTNINERSS